MLKTKLIDRYVFLLFARVFVLSFLCLTGIYIVGDFVNNLDDFIDLAKTNGGMASVLASYYGVRAPLFFDMVGRIVALIAAIFAVTWLQRHNEMAALMAAGISRWRIISPLLFGVVSVSLLAVANREFVLPRFKERLSQRAQHMVSDKPTLLVPKFDQLSNILISGKSALVAEKKIVQPRLNLPIDLSGFGRHLTAAHAIRKKQSENHPPGYLLVGVSQPSNIAQLSTAKLDDRSIILTPSDHDWLAEDECFLVSDVSLTQLTNGRAWTQFASTKSLMRALRNPSLDLGSSVPVTIHMRFVQPILDVLIFFLGVPIVLSRESRNVFVAMGSCLLVVVFFFVIVLGCQSFGINHLVSPALAAWLPLGIFVPWAAFVSEPLMR